MKQALVFHIGTFDLDVLVGNDAQAFKLKKEVETELGRSSTERDLERILGKLGFGEIFCWTRLELPELPYMKPIHPAEY